VADGRCPRCGRSVPGPRGEPCLAEESRLRGALWALGAAAFALTVVLAALLALGGALP
jgi:hypothetical protein